VEDISMRFIPDPSPTEGFTDNAGFQRKVEQLSSSLSALPIRATSTYTPNEIRQGVARGRHLRAEAIGATLTNLARWLTGRVRRAADRLRRRHIRRVAQRQLMALNNHVLRDVGLPRSEIPAVAERLANCAPSTGTAIVDARRLRPCTVLPVACGSASGAANDAKPAAA
jgi:uncharacterized protein YjiS (DUF1127 family)